MLSCVPMASPDIFSLMRSQSYKNPWQLKQTTLYLYYAWVVELVDTGDLQIIWAPWEKSHAWIQSNSGKPLKWQSRAKPERERVETWRLALNR